MWRRPDEPVLRRGELFKTHPVKLAKLLESVDERLIQLPDFQRGWVWGDDRIRGLLASISRGFPIGAVMMLDSGGDISFKCRPVEGAAESPIIDPEQFLLDGQQRLTSLYQALHHPGPVDTHDNRNRRIRRWYYLDMIKALGPAADREDAIVSVPENKTITSNIGRTVELDLSSVEKEYENHMMPTEQIMDAMDWLFGYNDYWQSRSDRYPNGEIAKFRTAFNQQVIKNFTSYDLPVISLDKSTPKEAVCMVFEKVNTGGVILNTFELVTAIFAASDFSLRDNWAARRHDLHSKFGVLQGIEGENFLQAVTLLAKQNQRRKALENGDSEDQAPAIGCRKRDLLDLSLQQYQDWADKVQQGFEEAAKFLHRQFIYSGYNVPYNTQLVSLAALYAEMGGELESDNATKRLERWFWCGIFGEIYGGPTETLLANDFVEVPRYIRDDIEPRSVSEANFTPERLISLRTRNSAAYKGLYALQMKCGAKDWRKGEPLSLATWHEENIDIHHIFPISWCKGGGTRTPIPSLIYNSIINRTPIDAKTNRIIGGNSPSEYLRRLGKHAEDLDDLLRTHWLSPELLRGDRFADCFEQRGHAMLRLVGEAMGKTLVDERDAFRSAVAATGYEDPFDEEDDEFDALGDAAYDGTVGVP